MFTESYYSCTNDILKRLNLDDEEQNKPSVWLNCNFVIMETVGNAAQLAIHSFANGKFSVN